MTHDFLRQKKILEGRIGYQFVCLKANKEIFWGTYGGYFLDHKHVAWRG